MRAYFQLFFGLLIPLSALFVVAAIIYFNIEYDFNKAIRLGVLSGVFIGVGASLVMALLLLISRAGEKTKNKILNKKKKTTQKTILKTIPTQEPTKTIQTVHPKTSTVKKQPKSTTNNHGNKSIVHTIMLLMDKELAFEVALYAITDEKIGTLTESKDKEDHITIKNGDEILQIEVTPLTRHTAQVTIRSNTHSESTQKIIRYMKNKEYSFLQY